MGMKKVKIESADDLEALPEDEWVYCPEGLNAEFVHNDVDLEVKENKLSIRLPESVTKKLGLSKKDRFNAVYSGRKLIIEKV